MAPHSMRNSAMVRPMPRAPPVTMMTFPLRLKMLGTPLSWPAWTWIWSWTWIWNLAPGASGVTAEDEVSGIGASLAVVFPVEASVTSDTVAVGLQASSVWDS